jgi:hypothetical protein
MTGTLSAPSIRALAVLHLAGNSVEMSAWVVVWWHRELIFAAACRMVSETGKKGFQ